MYVLYIFPLPCPCINRLSALATPFARFHPNYPVMAHMWPTFLYLDGQYNPQRPSAGLFKGELLLRVRGIWYYSSTSCFTIYSLTGLSLHLHVSKFCLWEPWGWGYQWTASCGQQAPQAFVPPTHSLWCCGSTQDAICTAMCHCIYRCPGKSPSHDIIQVVHAALTVDL